MANFNLKQNHEVHTKDSADTSIWNINNYLDAKDQIDYLIKKAKNNPKDYYRIYLNNKLQYTQN